MEEEVGAGKGQDESARYSRGRNRPFGDECRAPGRGLVSGKAAQTSEKNRERSRSRGLYLPKLATVHDAIKIMAEANVVKPESEAGQVVPLTSHAAREFLEGDTSSILYVLEAVQKKKSGPLSRPEQMPPNRGCTLAKVPDFLKRNSRISCPSMRSPMLPRPARRSARLCKPARGPTERQGGRESILRVSIHAPPRGGRRASLMRELPGILFQSTPPYPAIETRFQSTPPASVSLEGQSFNPRPPIRQSRRGFNPRPPRQ